MSIQRYDILHPKMRDKGRFVLYADHIADKAADLHHLLSTLADIRAALGLGDKPMLSELARIIREVREQADRDEKAACKALESTRVLHKAMAWWRARAKQTQTEVERLTAERDAAVRERDAAVEALRKVFDMKMAHANFAPAQYYACVKSIVSAALAKIEGGRG